MMRFLFFLLTATTVLGCIVRPTEKRVVFRPYSEERKRDTVNKSERTPNVVDSSTMVTLPADTLPSSSSSDKVPESTSLSTLPMRFHLVAASFKSSANAENYLAKLKADGYQALLITFDTTKSTAPYKVAFASFSTKDDAQAEIERQRNSGAFPQTWMMESKP
jgi:cell division protein FtsN